MAVPLKIKDFLELPTSCTVVKGVYTRIYKGGVSGVRSGLEQGYDTFDNTRRIGAKSLVEVF